MQLFALGKHQPAMLLRRMAGSARPEDHLDCMRNCNPIDPCTPLLPIIQAGHGMNCREHVDEVRVTGTPFCQVFLIQAGGRRANGQKLVEGDELAVLLRAHRVSGSKPVESAALDWFNNLHGHLLEAVAIWRRLSRLHQQSHAFQNIAGRFSSPRPQWTMDACGAVLLVMLMLQVAHQSVRLDGFAAKKFFYLTSVEVAVAVMLVQGIGVPAVVQTHRVLSKPCLSG